MNDYRLKNTVKKNIIFLLNKNEKPYHQAPIYTHH